jgi:hypothetical protein
MPLFVELDVQPRTLRNEVRDYETVDSKRPFIFQRLLNASNLYTHDPAAEVTEH